MRGRSTVVGCLAFVLSCSGEEASSPDAPGSGGSLSSASGGAPLAAPTGGANPSGGSSGSTGGEQHLPPSSGGWGSGLTPQPCSLVAPTECPSPDLVYASVEPILRERCVVCHAGLPGGPWPLDTYGHVATWRDTIRAALLACAMPPSDSGMSIPPEESQRILEWIRCGIPP